MAQRHMEQKKADAQMGARTMGAVKISPAAKKAFEVFDRDSSGAISAAELVKILTRDTPAGKPLTEEDAREIIDDFDKRGVGELNVS